MINETIFLLTALLDLILVLACFRLGRPWLYAAITANLILISALGAKLISLAGFTTNSGNVFFAAVFFAVQLLVEHYGWREGMRSVWTGFGVLLLFILMGEFTVRYDILPQNEIVASAIQTLSQFVPRIALASITAYLLSQHLNVWLYGALKRAGRPLWLRSALPTAAGQALDSAIFFSIAFVGVLPQNAVFETMIAGFTVKVLVGFLSIPLFYLSTYLRREVTEEAVLRRFEERLLSLEPEERALLKSPRSQRLLLAGLFVVIVAPVIVLGFLSYASTRDAIIGLEMTGGVLSTEARDLVLSSLASSYALTLIATAVLSYLIIRLLARVQQARRLAEEDARLDNAILSSVGEGLVVVDQHYRIVAVNPAAEKLLGMAAKELVGQSWKALTAFKGEEALHSDRRPVAQAMQTGEVVMTDITDNLYFAHSSGRKFPVSVVAAPFSTDTVPTGAVVAFRDISDEKRLEEARTNFISIAAHQLRTPLTPIRWFTEMLLGGDVGRLSKEQRYFVDKIEQETERMRNLLNILLRIARYEAGRVRVAPERLNLKTLTLESVDAMQPLLKAKSQQVIVRAEPDPLPLIPMDRDILWQVIQNLLSNAHLYSPRSSQIHISISQKGKEVLYVVKDEGIGIPKAAAPRIFERFFRAANAAKIIPEGTGLGLALVKSLVEGWGGKVWFESEEGKGTTFYFTVPLEGMKTREGEVTLAV